MSPCRNNPGQVIERGHFANPILPGFYPDPSICRVGEDYYLVCSSFAYFPGVPIFHSRDLVHWQQIGNVLDRPSQLNLDGVGHSEGIFAPTLRHHKGMFYLITTNISRGGNFIVTSRDPRGPWSEPHWLPTADGIDPSLFFDDDGRAWFCGTHQLPQAAYFGDCEIWLQELDLDNLQLKGPATGIWRGALRNCIWPEAPHIYHKDGWYYLLHAEGGTDIHHAVCVARCRTLTGPWEGNPANPILTHRHLGKAADICNVGHGDLVQTPAGDWWMVVLASRPQGGARNLGRETFLIAIGWENDWPRVANDSGLLQLQERAPELSPSPILPLPACEQFDDAELPPYWLQLRTPNAPSYQLTERPGFLRLYSQAVSLRELGHPGFVGRRQQDHDWQLRCDIEFIPLAASDCAGVVLLQSNDWQYRLEIGLNPRNRPELRLIQAAGGPDSILARRPLHGPKLVLLAICRNQVLSFYGGCNSQQLQLLIDGVDATILSTDRAGGFVGTVLGLFCYGGQSGSAPYADFDWFEYSPL